jgi:phosphoserine phosphatase
MLQVVLVRPGSTAFDEEGRIKGSLDIPLSALGEQQSVAAAESLRDVRLDCLYLAPCESAQATGRILVKSRGWKARTMDCLRNIDHGLWQGKLVDEVRRLQPRVYKQFQENPIGICPPGGEMLHAARGRIEIALQKLVRRHRRGTIGLVVPEPMASVVRCQLLGCDFDDVWNHQRDAGTWEMLALAPEMALGAV